MKYKKIQQYTVPILQRRLEQENNREIDKSLHPPFS